MAIELGGADSRAVLAAFLELDAAALICVDGGGSVVSLSAGAEALLGYASGDVVGRDVSLLIHEDHVEAHRRAFASASNSPTDSATQVSRRGLARHRDGTLVPVEFDLRAVALEAGRGWVAAIRPRPSNSAGASADDPLVTAQRMELLGELASGVAHDLNNLLTPILASAELLEGAVSGLESRTDLRAISNAAQSGRQLLRQLLLFAGRQETRPEVASPADVGRHALEIMRHALPAGVRLELSVADALPATRVDPVQLEQVLLNLVGNAIHACRQQGGVVRVCMASAELGVDDAPGGRAGRYLRLRVQDDGRGVPEPLRARIFEPFFTTKPAGVGTGLGLHVSRGIATRHGGDLRLERSERGASFALYLPAAEEARAPAQAIAADVDLAAIGLRRALVVDDDEVALRALSRLLGRFELEVHSYADPKAAVEALQQPSLQLDVMLTDASMPIMTGRELAEAARRIRPELPILLVTGLGRGQDDERGVYDGVLAKPFTRGELRHALTAAVAARGDRG